MTIERNVTHNCSILIHRLQHNVTSYCRNKIGVAKLDATICCYTFHDESKEAEFRSTARNWFFVSLFCYYFEYFRTLAMCVSHFTRYSRILDLSWTQRYFTFDPAIVWMLKPKHNDKTCFRYMKLLVATRFFLPVAFVPISCRENGTSTSASRWPSSNIPTSLVKFHKKLIHIGRVLIELTSRKTNICKRSPPTSI